MILEQYGVKYTRVTEKDIELIRYWRNQSFISNTMQYKEYITAEMQLNWFKKINNKYNYYFVIEFEGVKIGLINYKDPAPGELGAEGGIFIWDKNYWGTPIPVFASLILLDFMYVVLNLNDNSIITIAKDNERALFFNKALGYEIFKEIEGFYKLVLTKERYLKKAAPLKKAATIYCKGQAQLKVTAMPSDICSDILNDYFRKTTR